MYFQEYDNFIQTSLHGELTQNMVYVINFKFVCIIPDRVCHTVYSIIGKCTLNNTGEVCKWFPVQISLVIKLFTIVCGQQFLKVDVTFQFASQLTRLWEPSSIHKSKQLG